MFSWLKKHFIPHEGNNHRPHILRDLSMRNLVAIIIFLEIFSFLIPTITRLNFSGGMAAVLPALLDDLTNVERAYQNLPTLAVSPVLNAAAQMKAEDMATLGYFAHTSPEGKTPWYWIEKVGYQYQYAGENLAINFSDSKDVTNAWMNSPTHKANIVKENYTEIGTGVASGLYQGRETVFVAQVYANPLPKIKRPFVKPVAKAAIKEPVKTSMLITTTKEPSNVLGAETVVTTPTTTNTWQPGPQPSFFQTLIASPRSMTDKILDGIFALVGISLLLYIFLKIKHHHADLITNGLVVLAVIGGILLANYYISYHNMIVADSFDYSVDTK